MELKTYTLQQLIDDCAKEINTKNVLRGKAISNDSYYKMALKKEYYKKEDVEKLLESRADAA